MPVVVRALRATNRSKRTMMPPMTPPMIPDILILLEQYFETIAPRFGQRETTLHRERLQLFDASQARQVDRQRAVVPRPRFVLDLQHDIFELGEVQVGIRRRRVSARN